MNRSTRVVYDTPGQRQGARGYAREVLPIPYDAKNVPP